jgi:hypothetical protein
VGLEHTERQAQNRQTKTKTSTLCTYVREFTHIMLSPFSSEKHTIHTQTHTPPALLECAHASRLPAPFLRSTELVSSWHTVDKTVAHQHLCVFQCVCHAPVCISITDAKLCLTLCLCIPVLGGMRGALICLGALRPAPPARVLSAAGEYWLRLASACECTGPRGTATATGSPSYDGRCALVNTVRNPR